MSSIIKRVLTSKTCEQLIIIDLTEEGISITKIKRQQLPQESRFALPLLLTTNSLKRHQSTKQRSVSSAALSLLTKELQAQAPSDRAATSQIVFGSQRDPLSPFESSFDLSLQILELLAAYAPEHLTLQTRSPLVMLALPVLYGMRDKTTISIGLETCDQNMSSRYTPGVASPQERISTAKALKEASFHVHLQISPLLPYGDQALEATNFARIIWQAGESWTTTSLSYFLGRTMPRKANLVYQTLAMRLAKDGYNKWLKTGADGLLLEALSDFALPKPPAHPLSSTALSAQVA